MKAHVAKEKKYESLKRRGALGPFREDLRSELGSGWRMALSKRLPISFTPERAEAAAMREIKGRRRLSSLAKDRSDGLGKGGGDAVSPRWENPSEKA